MSTFPQSEIKAIGKLLKSTDQETLRLLEEQLKTFDTSRLREIYNELPLDDIKARKEFLDLALKISREQLKKNFKSWCDEKLKDLETGVFHVAKSSNPLLDFEHYSKVLDNWSETLGSNLKKVKLGGNPTSIINEVNHFVFMDLKFKGNKENYYDPENSFIDKVIDRKLGNPILLSVVYILITSRLGLPFSGVNMPAHFLVQYVDAFEPIFIDPFNQGEIITKQDCQERIKSLKLTWQDDYLHSPDNKQIVIRIMQNLINIYQAEGSFDIKEYLENYVNIIKRSA